MIVKVTHYQNEEGGHILEHEVVDGEQGDVARFVANGVIVLNTPMGKIPKEFQTPIEAETIQEAFAKLKETLEAAAPEVAEEAKKELMEQMEREKNKIIVPQ